MPERKMSKKSLENLTISNRESNRLTRESLEISLLQLLEKKELAKITILEELFGQTVHNIMEKMAQFDFKTELYQVWLALFKEAQKEAHLIRLAVEYNLEKHLTQAVFNFLEKGQESKKDASSYVNSFWSSALVSVLSKWIKEGMKVPAEKIASLGLPLMVQENI